MDITRIVSILDNVKVYDIIDITMAIHIHIGIINMSLYWTMRASSLVLVCYRERKRTQPYTVYAVPPPTHN